MTIKQWKLSNKSGFEKNEMLQHDGLLFIKMHNRLKFDQDRGRMYLGEEHNQFLGSMIKNTVLLPLFCVRRFEVFPGKFHCAITPSGFERHLA